MSDPPLAVSGPVLHRNGGALIRSGADLVELVERLYMRLFTVALWLVVGGTVLSVVYARLQPQDWHGGSTAAIAAGCATAALLSIRGDPRAYLWLRGRRWRAGLPGLLGGAILVLGGPGGPLWFVALAAVALTAVLAAPGQTIIVALLASGCYVLGTVFSGASLVPHHDAGRLSAAGGLTLDGLLCIGVVEMLARFVLRLHRLELEASGWPPAPIQLGDIGGSTSPPRRRPQVALPRGTSRLTARQLEAVVLLRDGLRQEEIAACMSISSRQVERLVAQARRRADARTTAELVALLVRGGLVPPPTGGLPD